MRKRHVTYECSSCIITLEQKLPVMLQKAYELAHLPFPEAFNTSSSSLKSTVA
jgi:hypothetical protein